MAWVVILFIKHFEIKNSQFGRAPFFGKMTAKASVFQLVSVFYVFKFILNQYFGREWSLFR